MQEIDLTDDQRLYLQRIFDCLKENRQWPTHSELDRWFDHFYPHLDIEEIGKSLPPDLTSVVSFRPESTATLTVPAVYLLKDNTSVLNAFVEIIKYCERIYSVVDPPVVSSESVLQANPLWWNITVYIAGYLLAQEIGIWSSFGGSEPSHWDCTLDRKIRRFRGITTIEDYLEKRVWFSQKPSISAVSPMLVHHLRNTTDLTGVGTLPIQDVQFHPIIQEKCWHLYVQGDYDDAIFNATKAIEVAVRQKARLAKDLVGADVITQAFNVKDPILYYSDVRSEQEGMMAFLRGIIQVYKNPQSHRHIEVQNKLECFTLLLLCSNLLYMINNLEVREKEIKNTHPAIAKQSDKGEKKD